jgi:predicted nucleotidyltransferase
LRDQARPDSDVDLLVQFRPGAKTYDRFLALSDLLEKHLGQPVELVTTDALSPFIGPRILAEAQDVPARGDPGQSSPELPSSS